MRIQVLIYLVALGLLAGCISKGEYREFVKASEAHVVAVSRPAVDRQNAALAALGSRVTPGQVIVNENLNHAQTTYEQAVIEAGERCGYAAVLLQKAEAAPVRS